MARRKVGTHQHLCHSDLRLQAFLAQGDELAHALLLQMQKLRLEEEMSLPELTREEPELEHKSPGFCPKMKSQVTIYPITQKTLGPAVTV